MDHFARIGVDDRHQFVAASGEEDAVLGIDCQAAGMFAGRQRPAIVIFKVFESISMISLVLSIFA